MNPLINLPDQTENCPIHIMITKPGAIFGEDAQREEIARLLPKPNPGKYWAYQQIAAQPLRFATMENADLFMKSIEDKKPTDQYFVPPMYYDGRRKKWSISEHWGKAVGELVVFAQVDVEPSKQPATD